MFINCTNHPYSIWSEKERECAAAYGEVEDLPFPQIAPDCSREELRRIAGKYAGEIRNRRPAAVMVAGEFSFTFMLVDMLLADGIRVVCSRARRQVQEVKHPDGTNEKQVIFDFEGFEEYCRYEDDESVGTGCSGF